MEGRDISFPGKVWQRSSVLTVALTGLNVLIFETITVTTGSWGRSTGIRICLIAIWALAGWRGLSPTNLDHLRSERRGLWVEENQRISLQGKGYLNTHSQQSFPYPSFRDVFVVSGIT